MEDLDILKVVVYAICKALMITGEIFGYWFITSLIGTLAGNDLTEGLLIKAALVAFAWCLFSRVLISWADV